jgi:hypothetical protein
VPKGGWAPQADSRLFALKDFWRPGPHYTTFYPCSSGMCQREEPAANGTEQLGYKCRDGHTVRLLHALDMRTHARSVLARP